MNLQKKKQQTLWWKHGVIYQIYPRSFKDSNNDGIGDLKGIISKIEYLKWLGVDAIWLSPIYPSPMADFGYDISNYTGIDPSFGSMSDFDALVGKAHSLGLKIILDYVPSHTSDQHPWFLESRGSINNSKRDWYIWRDGNGAPPNNWLSHFGGPAWSLDEQTNHYYLHSFLHEQPDLNWHNPEVQQAMLLVLEFWMEKGVDGFRIDAVDMIAKDTLFRDEPPNPIFIEGEDIPRDSLLHTFSEFQPELHEFLRYMRKTIDVYEDRLSIGEINYRHSPDTLATLYGNDDQLHLPFHFQLIRAAWNASSIQKIIESYEKALPSMAWPNYVLGNHDVSRLASRIGVERARLAAMLLLTLRGTPFIYYGDEIGMTDAQITSEDVQDKFGKLVAGRSRDPERSPMRWDSDLNGGFSQAEPWLAMAGNQSSLNVAAQQKEPFSILHLYHRLLHYRKGTAALHRGSWHLVQCDNDDCFVYLRQSGSQRRLVALNFSDIKQELFLPDTGDGKIVISTLLDREEAIIQGTFILRPNEGCLMELPGNVKIL